MASSGRQFLILPVNQENTFQNTVVYWEEEVFPFATYTIRTGGTNIRAVGVWNGHWYTLGWDNTKFPYFHKALPDIDDHNKKTNGRAPNDYEDVPSFYTAQEEPEEANLPTQDPSGDKAAAPPEQLMQEEPIMSIAATTITTTYTGGRGGPPNAGGGGPSGSGGGGGPPGGGPPGGG